MDKLNESVYFHAPYSTSTLAIISTVLSIIIAVTITGNIFVIAAYIRDPRIRANVANLLFVNLAITDFVVGAFSLTLNLSRFINNYWPYGELICKFWSVLDYSVCWMSMIVMVVISWDRYCLVTMGLKYKTFQTRKRIGLIILLIWVLVFAFWFVVAFAWSPITGESYVDYSNTCNMEFVFARYAPLVINVIPFAILLGLVVVLNITVYVNIYRRSQGRRRGPSASNMKPSGNSEWSSSRVTLSEVSLGCENGTAETVNIPGNIRTISARVNHKHEATGLDQKGLDVRAVTPAKDHPEETCKRGPSDSDQSEADVHEDIKGTASAKSCPKTSDKQELPRIEQSVKGSRADKEGTTLAKHRKAATVLGILTGCFIIFWSPYIITTVVFSFCRINCVSDVMWAVAEGMAWFNSTLNPFIYAATNVHFRRNFRQFLLLDRWACKTSGNGKENKYTD